MSDLSFFERMMAISNAAGALRDEMYSEFGRIPCTDLLGATACKVASTAKQFRAEKDGMDKRKAAMAAAAKAAEDAARAARDAAIAEAEVALTAMCLRKRGYPTPSIALKCAAKRMGKGAGTLRVYKCPACGEFHMTHKRLDEVAR